jgi:probable DNA repair protein
MIESILPYIEKQATILTPNRRLAATLHQLFDHHQQQLGRKTWQTPDILPLASWLQRLWHDDTASHFDNHPRLLTSAQEQFLWEKILTEAEESPLLLQVSQTADLARSARGLLKQWRVNITHPIFETAYDYLALKKWIQTFETECRTHNWLDSAALLDVLEEKIQKNRILLPKEIVLIGFNEISPQLNAFIQTCEMNNTRVQQTTFQLHASKSFKIALADQDTELYTLARWAKALHAQFPEAKIGCVIPTLDKIRGRVSQIFTEVFATDGTYQIDPQAAPFNISAGRPLQAFPVVHAALTLLSLYKQKTSSDTLTSVLTTPFIGEAESERIKRAHFDAALRKDNINTLNLRDALVMSDVEKRNNIRLQCPALTKRLIAYYDMLAQQPQKMPFSAWAVTFNALLTRLGWPGERSISSEEYQTVHAWLELLRELQQLDQVSAHVSYHTALQTVYKMATTSTFQPKTPETPIQVLGMLEAAGLPFDYLWVTGMDDMAWPPQPKPNPFIPKRLQRELNMPHATAERELIYCEQMTKQLQQSASQSIFSYAEKCEELEVNVSPLIKDFQHLSNSYLELSEWVLTQEKIWLARNMTVWLDEQAPNYQGQQKVLGGVDVIKQQALCPFKAFAKWRLHARELETTLPGLRPQDRGTIVHAVLERVWLKLKDHATLCETPSESLQVLIRECVDEAFVTYPNSRSHYQAYINLEKARLCKLVWDWLQIEKKRDPFSVVTSEKSTEITLNELTYSVRVDRIDEVLPNKKLIIDYKTGKNNDTNDWFTTRPEEPQLPLYTLIDPEQTVGITFAQLSAVKPGFKGVSGTKLDIDGVSLVTEIKKAESDNWVQQIESWKITLQNLSSDFQQGVAHVDPKHPVETCNYCKLQPLCRIHEENAIREDKRSSRSLQS